MSASGKFVPSFSQVDEKLFGKFKDILNGIEKLVVLTGAGISTESGIPDYRSEKVGLYARSNHRPVTHQEFMKSPAIRKRYWSRNFLAWPTFSAAPCNPTHFQLAGWERSPRFHWLITQNVDGLHDKAGSSLFTELHGSGHRVRCTDCGDVTSRDSFQAQLSEVNPLWGGETSPGELAPDGDVHIPAGAEEGFNVPNCSSCVTGIMKTDVVFFGDNVNRKVVDNLYEKVDECDGVLVLGSSLSVMSGYRFVYHAHLQEKPVLIVNIGETRADHLATLKLSTRASDIVQRI